MWRESVVDGEPRPLKKDTFYQTTEEDFFGKETLTA